MTGEEELKKALIKSENQKRLFIIEHDDLIYTVFHKVNTEVFERKGKLNSNFYEGSWKITFSHLADSWTIKALYEKLLVGTPILRITLRQADNAFISDQRSVAESELSHEHLETAIMELVRSALD